jgi:hypothetical protein
MIVALILIFILYVLPAYNAYMFVSKAHSRNGRWSGQKPNGVDVFFVFCPIANWILGANHLLGDWKSDYHRKETSNDYSAFF